MPNAKCKIQTPSGTRLHGLRVSDALRVLCAFCILHFAFGGAAAAQGPNFFNGTIPESGKPSSLKPEQLKEVSFKQRLNDQLPLEAPFKDEYGRDVTLGRYFNEATQRKPVILPVVMEV